MSRSFWFGSFSLLLLASLLFLFVSCFEQPVSPYQPPNTKIYLTIKSPTLTTKLGQYVDSLGDSINIGVTSNLPQFVDSVSVGIFSDAYVVEQGKVLKNINSLDKDPTWYDTLLTQVGKKYIIAHAFIDENLSYSDTTIIIVVPKSVSATPRSKPHITVNGPTTVAAGQVCSLSVTVNDSTVGQTHAFFAKQDTQSQFSVLTPPFKWTPQLGFSGTSTVIFKVADSDSNSYFDTQTVVITVLAVSPINHAPKWANKTINEVGSPGNAINLTVSKMCTDPDGDLLTFSLVSGISPSTDTVITPGDSSIYSFAPGPGDTGTFNPRVVAVDPLGLSDTMTITLKISAIVVKSYSVTYDGNGSTGGTIPSDPSTYTSGSTVTIKTNSGSLIKTGSTFAGWNTAADGTGTSYAASATFTIGSANITLYAMWIVNPVISAATAGNGIVTLTWAAVTGATSYNIYYTAGTTVDKTGTKVTGAASPAIVATLTNGTQYAFAVSAVNASGESALSTVATATPQVAAAGVPTISATTAGNAQVTVTWAAVTGATSYNIYYATGTTVDKTGTKVTGATSPAVVASLTNGTQYAFAVSAVNGGGESGLSAIATATPQVPAPGAATISSANAGNAQVTVTWAAVTGATSYNIYYTAGTTVDKTGTKVTGSTSPAVVASLTNGTQYAFAVSAVNAGGESALSAVATATPQVPAAGAPTISSANAGNALVTVTWAAVNGATSYNIYYAPGTTVDKTGTKVTGATSPAVVAALTNGTQYAFAVSAINAGGESALSTVATATPQAPAAPTISTQPKDSATCLGAPVSFSVSATGPGTLLYQWKIGTTNLTSASANTNTLTIANVAATDAGSYTCVVSNSGGGANTTSSAAKLTVNVPSTAATSAVANPTSVCSGGTSSLSVTGGTLGTGAAWKWYTDAACSTPVPTNNTGSPLTVTPSGTTTYYVRAEGTCGNSAAANVVVTVNSSSTAPTGASANPTSVCSGGTSSLSINGGTLGTGAAWKWYTNSACTAPVPSNNTGTPLTVTPSTTTTYYVRAEGTCGNSAAVNVVVTVNSSSTAPTGASANPTSVCSGGTSSLSITGGTLGTGAAWKWYTNSACSTPVPSNNTGTPLTVTPSTTTTYYVRAEGTCGNSATASTTVSVNSSSTMPNITTPQPICPGVSAVLTLSGSLGTGASWKWYDGSGNLITTNVSSDGTQCTVTPNGTTTYTVKAVGGSCDQAGAISKSVTVSVILPSQITKQSSDTTVEANYQATFTVVASGTNLSYQWRRNGSNISGANLSSYSIPSVSLTDAANYSCVVTGNCGSVTSKSVYLSVLGHTIGESFGGGIIFYINGDGTGQHGLVAATSDQNDPDNYQVWGCNGTDVSGTSSNFGTGFNNTSAIVKTCGGGINSAAGICQSYHSGGYTDWYLPSQAELDSLYNSSSNVSSIVFNMTQGNYWSSTYAGSGEAVMVCFVPGYGTSVQLPVTNPFYVRAIRSF